MRHILFIRKISTENPAWGEDKIALELKLKFGIEYSTSTIRRYMVDSPRPGQKWKTFLKNHASQIYAMDFKVVPMADLSTRYVLVIIELASRRVVHYGVTDYPNMPWLKQQFRNLCFETTPRFLIHDNDKIYGQLNRLGKSERGDGRRFRCTLDAWLFENFEIQGLPIPYGAPRANSFCERFIGTLKRECLDHFIFLSERHLRESVAEFVRYYNEGRPHQGIEGIPAELDSPREPPDAEALVGIVGEPILNGLHHDYRMAA